MISIAGLGFSKGLSSFAENKRLADEARLKAKRELEKENREIEKEKTQSALIKAQTKALNAKTFNEGQGTLDSLDLGDSNADTEGVPKDKNNTNAPMGGKTTTSAEQPEQSAVQPYSASTGGTDVGLGLGQQEPSYVRGMSLPTETTSNEPMVASPVEKKETTKAIQGNATAMALGNNVSKSLNNQTQKGQLLNADDFKRIPTQIVSDINGLSAQIQDINKVITNSKQAKEYLRQFRGKDLPQPGDENFPEFYKNFKIAQRATKAPVQLQAVSDQLQQTIVGGINTAIEQKDFDSASNLASQLGFTNKFVQGKDSNMIEILGADGKKIQELPFTLVQELFSNGDNKELNKFVTDTVKANTDYANDLRKIAIQNANTNQRTALNSLDPIFKVGTHYGVDTLGLFSGVKGAVIPIVAGDPASPYNPANPKSAFHKLALANGWLEKQANGTYKMNDGKLVPYDNKNMTITFNVPGVKLGPDGKPLPR